MMVADVNVLIYALRGDTAQHSQCRSWLMSVVEGESQFGVSPLVMSAVVRITTNPRIFKMPCSLDEAFGFCTDLLDLPHCRIIEPGARHWAIFERLCRETETRGPRVTDAWLAALAIEHGCEWITLDHDYARFGGLRWSAPPSAAG
jgi:hypothetical protein